jgi:hypothetical protein
MKKLKIYCEILVFLDIKNGNTDFSFPHIVLWCIAVRTYLLYPL